MVRVMLQSGHAEQVRLLAKEADSTVSDIVALAIEDATADLDALLTASRADQLPTLIRFLRGATAGDLHSWVEADISADTLRDFCVLIIRRTGANLTFGHALTAAVAWWLRPRTSFSRHDGEVHTKRCA